MSKSSMPDGPDLGLGLISSFIRGAVEEGMGVTAARGLFREQGIGRLSNETFGQLYGEARLSLANRDAVAGLAYDAIPEGSSYAMIRAGGPERFLTTVEVPVRESGTRGIVTRFYTHMTSDAHTPQEAVDAALQRFSSPDEDGTAYDEGTPLAGWVTGLHRTGGME